MEAQGLRAVRIVADAHDGIARLLDHPAGAFGGTESTL